MNGPMLIAVAAILVILLGWWFLRRRGGSAAKSSDEDPAERLDTIMAWPPQATRVLTSQERTLQATLTRALPDHLVLAQVPLARFIKVPKRHSYAEWLRRLGYQSVDFVVCDAGSHVVAAIELQPAASEMNERARKRLKRISRTLKAAQIPLHVWSEGNLPSADAVREAIIPPPAAVPTGSGAAASLPSAAAAGPGARAGANVPTLSTAAKPGTVRSPFDDSQRDSSQDELIEAPPSTWFDDLDSGPTPLPPASGPADKPKR
ncbi:MAG TPA: DUF2726 domain-containing protein [Burkholderiaceae bacterium]|nr:DUF2726 domain-containing protein [Burkholderiaceae bacterium]